jgi:hypothetical protein
MDGTVDVTIPVDPETASALQDPHRRAALGRLVSGLVTGDLKSGFLGELIADMKSEAIRNGITDEIVDAELEAWRAERWA